MQTRNRIFDDLSKLATGAAGAALSLRTEIDGAVRAFLDRRLAALDLVTRDEFEIVRAMAERAREENEALKARINALESQATGMPSTPAKASGNGRRRKKPAAAKPAKAE